MRVRTLGRVRQYAYVHGVDTANDKESDKTERRLPPLMKLTTNRLVEDHEILTLMTGPGSSTGDILVDPMHSGMGSTWSCACPARQLGPALCPSST